MTDLHETGADHRHVPASAPVGVILERGACMALDATGTRRCALAAEHDPPHGWERLGRGFADFGEVYAAASSRPPAQSSLGTLPEEPLRALAVAIKPTGLAVGPATAAGIAGLILARLHEIGWDVVRQ